jgi:protein required for attachment to host cells
MKIEHATWVVVADSEKFQVFENHGDADLLDLRIRKYEEVKNPSTHEQGADRPGRFPSPNGQVSAVADTDWHQLQKNKAAIDLAHRVNKWVANENMPGLVLIADPKTLGTMRPKLDAATRAKIVGELDKDLTQHPVPEIERLLKLA